MEKINEDEKKLNLIKCPLPKIIYMSMKGLTVFPKSKEKTTNNTTYYTKKLNPQQTGLPSLKMNTKFSFSPNKTNYTKGKQANNLNNINAKKSFKYNNTKIEAYKEFKNSDIRKNKENKNQTLKDILNSYGLNRYYEKFIQNGINDQNFNQIGFMNKKGLNDFMNILNIFPSHTTKMEQLYFHLKKQNNGYMQSQSNNNIHLNSSTKEIKNSSNSYNSQTNLNNSGSSNNLKNNKPNNNVNYVTLTFNRTNLKKVRTRVSHSQNKSKYRYINPTINPKRANSNRLSSEKSKLKNTHNINIPNNRPNLGSKNISKKRSLNENIMSKYNFSLPKPVNAGRNDLIKYFFKELDNLGTNMSNNISNLTNLNLFKSHNNKKNLNFNKTNNSSLTGNIKEVTRDKKSSTNVYYTKYREKHSAPENNLQDINRPDLPSIKNLSNRHIKITTSYNKSLLSIINENPNANIKPNIEMKTGYNKMKKQLRGSHNNNNAIDNQKRINGYQIEFNVNINANRKLLINKENLKNNYNNSSNNNNNINLTHSSLKSQVDINKKNKINNGMKLKLPNVIKKIDIQNAFPKTKPKNRIIKNLNRLEEGNKNLSSSSSNILYKKEKTNSIIDNNVPLKPQEKKQKKEPGEINTKEKEKKIIINNDKPANEIKQKKENPEEIKKDNNTNIMNINIEEKNTEPILSKENNQDKNEIIPKSNSNSISEPIINPNQNFNLPSNTNNTDKNLTPLTKEIKKEEILIPNPPKEEIISNQKEEKNEPNQNDLIREREENLEDMIYESLRINRSFSENKTENIYYFDLEYMCRCLGLCLAILIETSKESPHITEINLEALSASEIKYFFFNDVYNENINFLFDLFDKEVNTNINMEQISPLDKLESFLASNNNENINLDVNYLKHIRKEKDEALIKAEEEKEKEKLKENEEEQKMNNLNPNQNMAFSKDGFKIRTGFGDIERDIRFIDEFFSINNRKKKKAKNYNFISDKSKNILCKELSYINEIDSELNGTNSNINNTNLNNNSNSNNNINEKNFKEENEINSIDNEDIKEIQNNNVEEENNNTFNNEMNELGITAESNDDNINKNNNNMTAKNMSNNNSSIKVEDGAEKKQEDTINLNDDNKILPGTIFNDDNNTNEKVHEDKKNKVLNNIPSEITINDYNDQKFIGDNNQINNDDDNDDNENNNLKSKKNSLSNANKQDQHNNVEKNNSPNQINNNQTEQKKEIQNLEEDNLNESDYILDIGSIDELTYYLVKRAEIFDEDFNYLFMKISERRYIPTPEPQTIFDFMADIIILTKMEKEVVVLSLIYIERLIFNTGLLLTSRNWRRIVLTSMIIASKIWDDNSFENGHFSQVFANLGVNEINTLERIFLELINYKVFVKQSEYFKYLMMIKIIALKYSYNGREIVKTSLIKTVKFQEFNEAMQNRMRKKVTLNNSAQF